MQTLIHADIFFFVTTIIVIVLALLAAVILSYVVVILKDIRELSRIVRREGEEITADVHNIREEIKEEMRYEARSGTSSIAAFLNFVATLVNRRKSHHYKK
ncbi:MAG: hypothetical protein KGJ35_00855 [Patescibacteria group bacterium]|nr:hypothetical protein [Patescibacteria group bacterium]